MTVFERCVRFNGIVAYCVLALCVLRTALNPPEYCVPKGGVSPSHLKKIRKIFPHVNLKRCSHYQWGWIHVFFPLTCDIVYEKIQYNTFLFVIYLTCKSTRFTVKGKQLYLSYKNMCWVQLTGRLIFFCWVQQIDLAPDSKGSRSI